METTAAKPEVEVLDILSSLEAYPNPVEHTAQIRSSLKASANASLKVYDFGGREVALFSCSRVVKELDGQYFRRSFVKFILLITFFVY